MAKMNVKIITVDANEEGLLQALIADFLNDEFLNFGQFEMQHVSIGYKHRVIITYQDNNEEEVELSNGWIQLLERIADSLDEEDKERIRYVIYSISRGKEETRAFKKGDLKRLIAILKTIPFCSIVATDMESCLN